MKINLTENELKYLTKTLKLLNYCEKNLKENKISNLLSDDAESLCNENMKIIDGLLDKITFSEKVCKNKKLQLNKF